MLKQHRATFSSYSFKTGKHSPTWPEHCLHVCKRGSVSTFLNNRSFPFLSPLVAKKARTISHSNSFVRSWINTTVATLFSNHSPDTFTDITFLGSSTSLFGTLSCRTPLCSSALMFSTSTCSGKRKARANDP
jgi:hypothetical protein